METIDVDIAWFIGFISGGIRGNNPTDTSWSPLFPVEIGEPYKAKPYKSRPIAGWLQSIAEDFDI